MQWSGYKIFQNEEFLKLYCDGKNYEIIKFHGHLGYTKKIPILGYTFLKIPFPNEPILDDAHIQCKTRKIPLLEITTPYKDDAIIKYLSSTEGTFVIDLNKSIEELWRNLNQKTRNEIRQAQKKQVIIQQTHNNEDFDKWWQLYCITAQNKGFSSLPYKLVHNVFMHRDLSQLFIAKIGERIVAGAFILIDVTPLYWLACTDKTYSSYRPNNLLQWEIINWCKQRGYPFYDMGGAVVNRDHGPTHFKKGFSGEYKEYYVYNIPINPFRSRVIQSMLWGYSIVKDLHLKVI